VPYGDVVEVEQQLISEGLPSEEILKLCDLHTSVLKGQIDRSDASAVPPGHPVHTFQQENRALQGELALLDKLYQAVDQLPPADDATEIMEQIRVRLNALADVEKHYLRKENLLFPFLEKHEITGPPSVMWGKHDETRALIKPAVGALENTEGVTAEEARTVIAAVIKPVSTSIAEMIFKEEEILLPMSLDTLTDAECAEVYNQSLGIGFCLYDPTDEWHPAIDATAEATTDAGDAEERIQLPSGSFSPTELNVILNTIPFDLTFVDKDDTVRYFTQGRERIFQRDRAILGRKVQMCHPPKSVHIVQQILKDFRSGAQDHAAFWISLGGRFVHIEYHALRDAQRGYLGTLEVSQDLTEKRALTGEQRLLSYADANE
jgi:DUF438 domain-containing protein